jgi:SAM-dependent methyltransferase
MLFTESFESKSALWNRQYESGKWDILKSPLEEERFNKLIELTREYRDNLNILEIGCGEGLLLQKFDPGYNLFLGVDISQVAISRTSHLKNEKTSFEVSDMEVFIPSQKFDLIIFNETVYYSKHPLQLIKRYITFLNTGGVIATSIFGNDSGVRMVEIIEREFRCLKRALTRNERGLWYCHIFDAGPAK